MVGPADEEICPYDHLRPAAELALVLVQPPPGMLVEGLLADESSKPLTTFWSPSEKI